jgi:hypothetical protein
MTARSQLLLLLCWTNGALLLPDQVYLRSLFSNEHALLASMVSLAVMARSDASLHVCSLMCSRPTLHFLFTCTMVALDLTFGLASHNLACPTRCQLCSLFNTLLLYSPTFSLLPCTLLFFTVLYIPNSSQLYLGACLVQVYNTMGKTGQLSR